VSLSDSPLLRLEPLAEKLITSAERRFAAASKEILVRVGIFCKEIDYRATTKSWELLNLPIIDAR
jgi:hypothetical protein